MNFHDFIYSINTTHMDILYNSIPTLQAAINRIATTVSSVNIRIFDKNNNEIIDGDLFNLVNNANTLSTTQDVISKAIIDYYLYGIGAIEIHESGKLRSLCGHYLIPINNAMSEYRDDIRAYTYNNRVISKDNLIIISNPNPSLPGDINVISPISSLLVQLDTYKYSVQYFNQFFKNSGAPSLIISLPSNTHEDDVKKLKQKWAEMFNGRDSGLPFFVTKDRDGNKIDVQQLNSKLSDLVLPELHKITVDDISSATGVPSILLNSSNSKYDNSQEQLYAFYASTIYPLINKLQAAFQHQLINSNQYVWQTSTKSKKTQISKDVSTLIKKAKDSYKKQNLYIILDKDSLPYMPSITIRKVDLAKALIDIGVNKYVASNYADLDINEDDFVKSNTESNSSSNSTEDKNSIQQDKNNVEQVKQVKEDNQVKEVKQVKQYKQDEALFINKLKKATFNIRKDMLANGSNYTLKDVINNVEKYNIEGLNVNKYAKYIFKNYHKGDFKSAMNLNKSQLLSYRDNNIQNEDNI